jgi:hypothetical protein
MDATELDLRTPARAERLRLGEYASRLSAPAIATWRARMLNEYTSSEVFEALARELAGAGFATDIAEECAAFAEEERRHGVLCAVVVEGLGGEARVSTPARRAFPRHRDAPARARALRSVIHVCCMSETVAVSLIGAERLQMPEGPLRELLTRIWADEVGHARFGWRLLETCASSLDGAERRAIEAYLPVALADLEAHELTHLPDRDAPPGGECLGLCSGREARVLLHETIEHVIRPGLRRWFHCA